MPECPVNGYAFLVGVGRSAYPPWSLPITARQAVALRDLLVAPHLCAYSADRRRVQLLIDDASTRANILAGIEHVAQITAKDPNAIALIYFSGHGWFHGPERYFLLPHDVAPHQILGTALPVESLIIALRNIRAPHPLVILDTCHATGIFSSNDALELSVPEEFQARAISERLIRELIKEEGRAVISSGNDGQNSWSPQAEGLNFFTEHLLAALGGAGSPPEEKIVMLTHLSRFITREVKKSAEIIGYERISLFRPTSGNFSIVTPQERHDVAKKTNGH